MKKSNWGGYRPGSGQKPKWKSGETKPLRIPIKLHEQVLAFTQLLDSEYSPEDLLLCDLPSHLGSVTESKGEKTTNLNFETVTPSTLRERLFDNITQPNETVTLSSQEIVLLRNETVTLSSELKELLADWNSKASRSSNPKWHHAKKLLAELNQLINE
ncbi:MAG: hypothetical protein AB4057_22800 [Crocosphaera sp.]